MSAPETGNGNGKISLSTIGLIAVLVGGGWALVKGEVDHQRDIINEVKEQLREQDVRLQREMRLINEAIMRTAEGNDHESLARHNFQEQEIRDLKTDVDRLEHP